MVIYAGRRVLNYGTSSQREEMHIWLIIWLKWSPWDTVATATAKNAWVFVGQRVSWGDQWAPLKDTRVKALNEATIISLKHDILIKPWLPVRAERSCIDHWAVTGERWTTHPTRFLTAVLISDQNVLRLIHRIENCVVNDNAFCNIIGSLLQLLHCIHKDFVP